LSINKYLTPQKHTYSTGLLNRYPKTVYIRGADRPKKGL